jgi:hypothetical protein
MSNTVFPTPDPHSFSFALLEDGCFRGFSKPRLKGKMVSREEISKIIHGVVSYFKA